MQLVFVYGSLKKGFHNHFYLSKSDYLGPAETEAKYSMLHLGGFPGVVMEGDTVIKGEVYSITPSVLLNLDRLEGYPNFYTKTEVDTEYGPATMYVLNQDSRDIGRYRPPNYPEVPTGEWTQDEANHRRAS